MAIIMACFDSNLSSYYSNLSSIRTSIVTTIVTSRSYYSSTVGQSTVSLVACLVPILDLSSKMGSRSINNLKMLLLYKIKPGCVLFAAHLSRIVN